MKKIITIFNILIVSVISFNLYTTNTTEVVFKQTTNNNKYDYIAYNQIIEEEYEIEEETIEVKIDETLPEKTEVKKEVVTVIEKKEPIKEEIKKEEVKVNNTENILETLNGSMSGYGPDCYGCTSNRVASGYYVGEGNIYYEDKTYGKVRIVAGDKKYPLGTIVKIGSSKVSNEPIIAIVLDRGGDIGINKKFTFDLLFATEKEASKYGVSKNIKFEILRLGY